MKAGLIVFAAIVSFSAAFADIVEDLPAGGKYVFDNGTTTVTVNCTAKPQVPTVLRQTCGCYGVTSVDYILRLTTLLSDGTERETTLSTMGSESDCWSKLKNEYKQTCQGM